MYLKSIAQPQHLGYTVSAILVLSVVAYVVYQRFIHPLARYPGPFWASLTDIWQVLEFLSLKQPYRLTELHEKYGPVVRYGPDKISITHESSVQVIYQKSSRALPKTEYYDAFGGAHPNVFGTRDEAHHSVRRRHMSHAFSMTNIKSMEQYIDANLSILKGKIYNEAVAERAFDLKKFLHYYVVDVLGDLAFSKSFDLQVTEDESRVPPVKEHSLLAAATGAWPAMLHWLKWALPYLPVAAVQNLLSGRRACAELASKSVQRRLEEVKGRHHEKNICIPERKDLLTSLILAKHPDTGEHLTQTDLETEAFGFIIAGTHTTSASTTLLFYNLLHNPECMEQCISEVDANLPALDPDQAAYPITDVESALPYLRNCIKENFRLTPVFTMPLARRVTAPEGLIIEGNHFGKGPQASQGAISLAGRQLANTPDQTSIAVCNHAFHHNPAVWGPDHNTFDPTRWERPETAERSRQLMHFGLGGRQCIGKTMATTNIYKAMSTLLREFDFQLADKAEALRAQQGGFKDRLPALISVGVSDLEAPLMVTAKVR
ncbi:uncharacterized protein A1O9_09075 [Exophiala aquamarina CBS 119918]|uniref:Cytochrome P450 oxidoreductase n=1 Tax=Exophiala aquamarina CBS 119918 TaxID=1182545 RepID=A0A072P5S7_9EURO|nr:uncharacterized protein A1O9_09075 [Exophiala aquamarina CBS 119918]KEF54633.1 hypothetical protein A1O9_09075 [Exophiala aquamarina CBS 119918]